jgi:hypothetical protein
MLDPDEMYSQAIGAHVQLDALVKLGGAMHAPPCSFQGFTSVVQFRSQLCVQPAPMAATPDYEFVEAHSRQDAVYRQR